MAGPTCRSHGLKLDAQARLQARPSSKASGKASKGSSDSGNASGKTFGPASDQGLKQGLRQRLRQRRDHGLGMVLNIFKSDQLCIYMAGGLAGSVTKLGKCEPSGIMWRGEVKWRRIARCGTGSRTTATAAQSPPGFRTASWQGLKACAQTAASCFAEAHCSPVHQAVGGPEHLGEDVSAGSAADDVRDQQWHGRGVV